jgi:hypothetical protein
MVLERCISHEILISYSGFSCGMTSYWTVMCMKEENNNDTKSHEARTKTKTGRSHDCSSELMLKDVTVWQPWEEDSLEESGLLICTRDSRGRTTEMRSWLRARLGQELPLFRPTAQCHPGGQCADWRPCNCDVLTPGLGLEPCPSTSIQFQSKPLASSFKTCLVLQSHKPITVLLSITTSRGLPNNYQQSVGPA